ncbi:50S ribosome-binding GTPase [Allochromatium humboldtianum]|uniref:50S ribosome-binding GTPase n=1 Tax=Allochromatium humboldtianum TaxID=504901 RepID=A0A850R4F1_9GAMM|nr:GTPase [Allochromatium humboldtianum]NVZ08238.1 50S ribosome-binding GTPase [Allochromatium humboldtianum]
MSTLCPATLARLTAIAPHHCAEIERLSELNEATWPVVTVLGKYNHGKSSLLNALIGEDCFAVSDQRETRRISVQMHQGIQWMDTPGLDADVAGDDDRRAMQAARRQADVRLFIHAIDLGELDASELALMRELLDEQSTTGRPTVLVLTRIANQPVAEREQVIRAVSQQVPEAHIVAVSASSHQRGIANKMPALVQLGNLVALHTAITSAVLQTQRIRECERALLVSTVAKHVSHLLDQAYSRHEQAKSRAQATHNVLQQQFAQLQHRIATEIRG